MECLGFCGGKTGGNRIANAELLKIAQIFDKLYFRAWRYNPLLWATINEHLIEKGVPVKRRHSYQITKSLDSYEAVTIFHQLWREFMDLPSYDDRIDRRNWHELANLLRIEMIIPGC